MTREELIQKQAEIYCEICCLDFNLVKETVINDLTLKLNTAKAEFDKL